MKAGPFVILFASLCQASGQSQSGPPSPVDQYQAVLDKVFRVDQGRSSLTIELRIIPSLTDTESQIVLRLESGPNSVARNCRAVRMIYSAIQDGTGNIAREPTEALAKRIKVECREIPVPSAQVLTWYRDLVAGMREFLALLPDERAEEHRTGTAWITLDGTSYEIKIWDGLERISWRLYDCASHGHAAGGLNRSVCDKIDSIRKAIHSSR